MEIVIGILFAISLLGNWHQAGQVAKAEADAEKWRAVASENYQAWQAAITSAKTNGEAVETLRDALDQCQQLNIKTEAKINDFREVGRFNESAINELRLRLDRVDLSSCRVPSGVVFTTPGIR